MKTTFISRTVFYCICSSILVLSCGKRDSYENAKTFSFEDFKVQKELKAKEVLLDSVVMDPDDLYLMDSLLLVTESGREKSIYIYNLKSKKQIACQVNKGQGPNDMLYPQIIGSSDTTIAILGTGGAKLFIYNKKKFVDKKHVNPIKKINTKSTSCIDAELIENKLLKTCFDNKYQISETDILTDKLIKTVPFPVSNINFSTTEKQQAFYMNFTTNKTDRIAIAYYMTDLLEIYDLEGKLINRIYGPEHFISRFKKVSDGNYSSAIPKKGANRNTFFSPQGTKKTIYVLYNGKALGDKDYSSSCKILFSFSWDGTPQTIYNLDTPIFTFAVDEKHNKIYGITDDPEYRIIEYDL